MILRRGALVTSSPREMVARLMTPSVKGLIFSIEVGFPATTRMTAPAIAAAGAPKTGAATNSPFLERTSFSVCKVTSG